MLNYINDLPRGNNCEAGSLFSKASNRDGSFAGCGCSFAQLLRAQLVWWCTGSSSAWEMGLAFRVWTGLTGLTGDCLLMWSVCSLSLVDTGTRRRWRVSNGLNRVAQVQNAVFLEWWFCSRELAQTGLTGMSGRRASSLFVIFVTLLGGSGTSTEK